MQGQSDEVPEHCLGNKSQFRGRGKEGHAECGCSCGECLELSTSKVHGPDSYVCAMWGFRLKVSLYMVRFAFHLGFNKGKPPFGWVPL